MTTTILTVGADVYYAKTTPGGGPSKQYGYVIEIGEGKKAGRVRVQWTTKIYAVDGLSNPYKLKTWVAAKSLVIV